MANKNLVTPGVLGKLSSLRSTLKGRLAGEGLAWTLLALAATVVITFGLDYLLDLPVPLRVVFMAMALGGVCYVLWQRLLGPMLVPMKTESLALLVESHFDQLDDRFISALQFSSLEEAPSGMSQAMVDKVAEQANTMVAPLPFGSIVEFKRMVKMILTAGLVVLLLGGFGVWQSNLFGIWFERNVLLRTTPWPQDTYLTVGEFETVVDPDGTETETFQLRQNFSVYRGEDLRVIITPGVGPDGQSSTVTPESIVVHSIYEQVGESTEPPIFQMQGRDGYFEKVFRGVSEEFEFYVTCEGDKLDGVKPHKVTLLDTAELEKISYELIPPAYMELEDKSKVIESNAPVILVPAGGIIKVDCTSTLNLKSATVYINGRKVGVGEPVAGKFEMAMDYLLINPDDPSSGRKSVKEPNPKHFEGHFKILSFNLPVYERALGDMISLPSGFDALSNLADAIRAPATALASTTAGHMDSLEMKIFFENDTGYSKLAVSKQIMLKPDSPPEFLVFNPVGVSSNVSNVAMINLHIEAKDDYGIEYIQLMVGVNDEPMSKFGKQITARPGYNTSIGKVFNNTGYEQEQIIDLAQLGRELKPGDVIKVMAIAADSMPADYGGPNISVSPTRTFTVTENILPELLTRMEEIMGLLKTCRDDQQGVLSLSLSLVKTLEDEDDILPEYSASLSGNFGSQKQVRSQTENIAGLLEDVVTEMEHNQVSTQQQREKYKVGVIQEIYPGGNFKRTIDSTIENLKEATKLVEAELLRESLDEISAQQDELKRALDEMIKVLDRTIGLERALIGLNELKKKSQEMIKAIEDIINEGIGEFDD